MCSSCTQSGICLEVETSRALRPMASRRAPARLEDRSDRHLLAEVEDGVAVVGEDRVDQALADVVDVAEDGGQHDLALGVALELLQVRSRWATARFITSADWRTKGRISSPAPNLSPTSFMAGSSTPLSVGTAPSFSTARVDLVLHAVLLAVQDAPVERSSGSMLGGRVGGLGVAPRRPLGLEVGDEALQRVRAAVEDQVVGQRALGRRDLGVGRDVVRVDDGQVQAGLDAVVQEDGVEHRAGGRAMPKETLETPRR